MTDLRPTILCVDDIPANLSTLGAALAADFDLRIATSGAMALALAAATPPDLIILDVMMPDMDGFETCRRLKALPMLEHVPVVFMTALCDVDAEKKGFALGAADYLTKPVNLDIARQRIGNLLERERLRKQVEAHRDLLQGMITQRDMALAALRESDMRFRDIVEHSPIGMLISAFDGSSSQTNLVLCTMLGYARGELLQLTSLDLTHPQDRAESDLKFQQLIAGQVARYRIEQRYMCKDGRPVWVQLTASLLRGHAAGYVLAQIEDISERKLAQEKIRELAFFDSLTRLPNRTLLLERLEQAMAAGARDECCGALLFIDLDHFKTLNDTFGHDKGDLLLQQVAQRLIRCMREGDTVARLGGDEFVVVLTSLNRNPHDAANQVRAVSEAIRAALNGEYQLGDIAYRGSASVGATLFEGCQSSIEDVLKQADRAMYKAKATGRSILRFVDPGI